MSEGFFEPGRGEAYPCQDCGGSTRTWYAPHAVWNEVMGGPDGMLCPSCFILRAEKAGMVPTAWVLTMERPSRFWTWVPGFSRTEEVRTPREWEESKGVRVIDPDGWRANSRFGPKEFSAAITEDEFDRRAAISTVNHRPGDL